jgi:hypothetical protein
MFQNKRPLIFLLVTLVGGGLVTQQSIGLFSAYASESSPYNSGYDHGCDDAGRSESDKYINEPEKGPSFHTNEFMDGYYAGLNACSRGGGGGGGEGGDFDQPREIQPREIQPPDQTQRRGGIDWNAACQVAHTILGLQTPCDELVTSNNELTSQGEQVLACYAGGALAPLLGPAAASELYALGKMICPR